jgi:glycosyltransferase involved in cell wall biosynthesis
MKPPRLLHVFSTFDLGGPQARAVQLMNAWGSAYAHAIVSVGRGELEARKRLSPDVVADFPYFPDLKVGMLPARLLATRARIAELKPDLILTYNWGAMEVVMARRLFGGPPLVHHEDGFGPTESERFLARRTWFRRLALPAAQNLVVPSRVLQRIATEVWRRPPNAVTYIANGVDVAAFDAAPSADAIPGVTLRGVLTVGTVSGLREEKNLRRLVRVFAAAGRDGPAAQLVIVGTGPEREAILAEARAEGVEQKVHLPGFLPNPERYVGLFDVFALSSDTEQFPISLVEAMAARLPAVCTAVGDIRDVVAAENLPFIHPRDDEAALARAMKTLLSDADLRHTIGRANRARAQREFTLSAMIANYERVYGAALDVFPASPRF